MPNYEDDLRRDNKRELVLSPGEYAYIQDRTNGTVKTHCGPSVINLAGQLRSIRFNPDNRSFSECDLHSAVNQFAFAPQGDYLVLENPVKKNENGTVPNNAQEFPVPAQEKTTPDLDFGKKVNLPGPTQIALWPQQIARRIAGHDLRSDQYLIIRVYDEQLAKTNWSSAVAKPTAKKSKVPSTKGGLATPPTTTETEISVVAQQADQLNLTVGELFIIKGTDVSFFIPPTGVEVVPDENGRYVRDALTLEMSEYCILVDQSGTKRYEKGPQVVFPEPTEEFYTDNDHNKFKPIELNHLQGLHIKINCDYTDMNWPEVSTEGLVEYDERSFKEGEELFITGKTHSIYYPCEEHSIIRYGDTLIHYATCIPEGEARYVMNRDTGEIETRQGPSMLLLNPIKEVMVRRVLSDSESELMYPGNDVALDYNRRLRAMLGQTPSSRSGFVSEGDYKSNVPAQALYSNALESIGAQSRSLQGRSGAGPAAIPDEIRRKTEYTKPRTVTLDTKYDGVPKLGIWTGYAVLVTKANGERRVEVGPKTILLDYDETVEPLHLSTGKPKTTDKLLRTGYLRAVNNKVSDAITLESSDNIPVEVKVSYRVNFEGKPEKWFDVENYVKFLCDHARSKLKGAVKKIDIETFYSDAVAIIRDTILGTSVEGHGRPGLSFSENGMKVNDVEVLDVVIKDQKIAGLLQAAQHETIQSNIDIERAKKQLEVTKEREEVAQASAQAKFATAKLTNTLETEQVALTLALNLAKTASDLKRQEEALKVAKAVEAINDASHEAKIARQKAEDALEEAKLKLQTGAVVERLSAAQEGFSEALLALQDAQTLEKVAEALGPMRFIGGESVVDAITKVFNGTPLEQVTKRLTDAVAARGRALVSNGQ